MLTNLIKEKLLSRTEVKAQYTKPTEEEEVVKLYAEFKDFNGVGTLSINDKIFHVYVGEVEKVQIRQIYKHKIVLIEL